MLVPFLLILAVLGPSDCLEAEPIQVSIGPVATGKSLAALLATSTASGRKGCFYNQQKYQSGDEVRTEQPCLSCTCRKGVLLCSLRVCPPVSGLNLTSSQSRCRIVRHTNTCCPTLECTKGPAQWNEVSTKEEDLILPPLISLNASFFQDKEDKDLSKSSQIVSLSHQVERNTSLLQTVPSSSFYENHPTTSDLLHPGDSPLMLAKHNDSKQAYLDDLVQQLDKHCYIDGTFYAQGSAIESSSFCEYCYCIRGKRMCIRPRCHLSILGCLPRYANEFACCPTSYACGPEALLATNHTSPQSSLFYLPELDQNLPVVNNSLGISDLPLELEARNSIDSAESSVTTTTTTEPATVKISEVAAAKADLVSESIVANNSSSRECLLHGISYPLGDGMPSDVDCTTCFCAANGTRKCKRIECSLPLFEHNCLPITPEGHCCPLEFKCEAPTPVLNNETVQNSSLSLVANTTSDLNVTLTSIIPNNTNIVEGRQLMDTQAMFNQSDLTPSKESIENVANFLSSVFNAFKEVRKDDQAVPVESRSEPEYYSSPVPVPFNHLHGTPRADSSPMEQVKLQRDLPGPIHYNVRPHAHLNPAPSTLFSNGWRVIPMPASKIKPYVPAFPQNKSREDLPSESQQSSTVTSLVPSTTMASVPRIKVAQAPQNARVNDTVLNVNTAKCVYNGHEYANGELIPKSNNSCTFCRCFYGQELCQVQKCPPPPSPDCMAEPIDGQVCCPIYTCKTSKNETSRVEAATNKPFVDDHNIPKPLNVSPQSAALPALQGLAQPRINFPLDLIYGNRIHFPSPENKMNIYNQRIPINRFINSNIKHGLPNHIVNINQLLARPTPVASQHAQQPPNRFNGLEANRLDSEQTHRTNGHSPIRPVPQSPVAINDHETSPSHVMVATPLPPTTAVPASSTTVSTTTPTTTSTVLPPVNNFESLNPFQVSGCNIYGKMYGTGDEIRELSDKCKICICSSFGVQCRQRC